jgi:copper/silver efflux system protein
LFGAIACRSPPRASA